MAPIRGWGPKGERLAGFAPDGRWRTLTFLAALRVNALTEPCVIDGPINGEMFRAYVEQFLVPTLRPGDIVVLDNLGSHRSQAYAGRSSMRAPSSRSCRRILLILIRSSRPSLRSSIGCEWLRPAPSTPSTSALPNSSKASLPLNAATTSKMPDMLRPKPERL